MSYSFNGKATNGELTEWNPQPQQGYGEAESTADLEAVKEVVEGLAALLGGDCTISGGGHSNPDRDGGTSWATDCVSISVTRIKAVE